MLGEFDNKEKGFGIGVDDYMVKPINVKELVLRIRALLRRFQNISEKKVSIGNISLEYDQMKTIIDGKEIRLTQKEFKLLYKLFSYPNRLQFLDCIIHFQILIGILRQSFYHPLQ